MSEIKFGTDGWRGILDSDFTYANTDKVINGIASYIYSVSKFDNKIVVGYDPRNKADEFALYIANKLADFGFDVQISKNIVATPVIAYTALNRNAYGIMITASHNPPEYLGIKFIPTYGGPAEDYMVKQIVDNLETNFNKKNISKKPSFVDFEYDYIQHIKKMINLKNISEKDIKIIYDGHHGAAGYLFKSILDENKITAFCQNMERDINFGGFMPDPKEKYLPLLKQKCKELGLIGLSNDGDGDRFGVFDEKGNFISPNDIIAMLLKHLRTYKKYTGKLAKTVGASSLLDLYAAQNNTEVIETPVGFKWLGAAMRQNDVIIAGEESGGLSIKGHIPEKDGILANLLIMEMIAFSGKKLYELHEDFLSELNRKFVNTRIDLKLDNIEAQEQIINKFTDYNTIGSFVVEKKSKLDGLKLYLNDGSWILIRKSGTEPLLRIYIESDKEEKMLEISSLVKQLC